MVCVVKNQNPEDWILLLAVSGWRHGEKEPVSETRE